MNSLFTKTGNVRKLSLIYDIPILSLEGFGLAINWGDPMVYQHFKFYNLFIKQFKYYINFYLLFKYQDIEQKIILEHMDQYGDREWLEISKTQNLSINFINKYYEKLTWKEINYRCQIGAVDRIREKDKEIKRSFICDCRNNIIEKDNF